jgi:hypothetical protein
MSVSFMHSLMNPRSIGIVGAGNNPMKMGTLPELVKQSERDLAGTVALPFKNDIPMTVSSFFDRSDQSTTSHTGWPRINPVIISGAGPIAVDALIVLK